MNRLLAFFNPVMFLTACGVMALARMSGIGASAVFGNETGAALMVVVLFSVIAVGFFLGCCFFEHKVTAGICAAMNIFYIHTAAFMFIFLAHTMSGVSEDGMPSCVIAVWIAGFFWPFMMLGILFSVGKEVIPALIRGIFIGTFCAVYFGKGVDPCIWTCAFAGIISCALTSAGGTFFVSRKARFAASAAGILVLAAVTMIYGMPSESSREYQDPFDTRCVDSTENNLAVREPLTPPYVKKVIDKGIIPCGLLGAYLQCAEPPAVLLVLAPYCSPDLYMFEVISNSLPAYAWPAGHLSAVYADLKEGAVPPFIPEFNGKSIVSVFGSSLDTPGLNASRGACGFVWISFPQPATFAQNSFFTEDFFRRLKTRFMTERGVLAIDTRSFTPDQEAALENSLFNVFKHVIRTAGTNSTLTASDAETVTTDTAILEKRLSLIASDAENGLGDFINILSGAIPECAFAVRTEVDPNSIRTPVVLESSLGSALEERYGVGFRRITAKIHSARYSLIAVCIAIYLALRYFFAFHSRDRFAFSSFENGVSMSVFAFASAFVAVFTGVGGGFGAEILFFISGAAFGYGACRIVKPDHERVSIHFAVTAALLYFIFIRMNGNVFMASALGFVSGSGVYFEIRRMSEFDAGCARTLGLNMLCGICAGGLAATLFAFDATGLIMLVCIFTVKLLPRVAKDIRRMYFTVKNAHPDKRRTKQ